MTRRELMTIFGVVIAGSTLQAAQAKKDAPTLATVTLIIDGMT